MNDWFQATYVMSMNYRVGKKWVVVPYNVDFPDIRDINNFNNKDKKNYSEVGRFEYLFFFCNKYLNWNFNVIFNC